MEREPGYYWIKLPYLDWVIAEYDNGYWFIEADMKSYTDEKLEEINEDRILNPDGK